MIARASTDSVSNSRRVVIAIDHTNNGIRSSSELIWTVSGVLENDKMRDLASYRALRRHTAAKCPLPYMPVKNCCVITKVMDTSCKMEGDYRGQRRTTRHLWKGVTTVRYSSPVISLWRERERESTITQHCVQPGPG